MKESFIKVFKQTYNQEEPISYENFNSVGISKEDYMIYLSICERIRSAFILTENKFISFEKENEKYSIIDKEIEPLFLWLTNHNQEAIDPKFRLSVALEKYIYYLQPRYLIILRDDNYPYEGSKLLSYIFRSSDDFRLELERFISMILAGENIEWLPDEEISTDIVELKKTIKYINKAWKAIPKPEPLLSQNFSNAESVSNWARNYAEYIERNIRLKDKYYDLKGILEDLEFNRKTFDFRNHILYIHKGPIKCQNDHHHVECVNAVVMTRDDIEVTLNVNYCSKCGLHFLSYYEYERYVGIYNILVCKFKFFESAREYGYYDRNPHSPLSLCGYNVKQDGLSKSERQYLLSKLICEGIMSKSEVMNYLELFISTNAQRSNMNIARNKWAEDLSFVRDYNSSFQKTVLIDTFKPYSEHK